MTASRDFEEELQELISAKEEELQRAERRIERAHEARDAAVTELEHLRATLAIYREHYDVPAPAPEIDDTLRRQFEGLPLKEIAIMIARTTGGYIKVSDARRTLVRGGVASDERSASNNLYTVFERYGDLFHKVRRGEYELVTPHDSTPVETASLSPNSSEYVSGLVPFERSGQLPRISR